MNYQLNLYLFDFGGLIYILILVWISGMKFPSRCPWCGLGLACNVAGKPLEATPQIAWSAWIAWITWIYLEAFYPKGTPP